MQDCHPVHVPLPGGTVLLTDMDTPFVDSTCSSQLMSKLIYATNTRPDLPYAVSIVSRFMSTLQRAHLDDAKHNLRYIKKPM